MREQTLKTIADRIVPNDGYGSLIWLLDLAYETTDGIAMSVEGGTPMRVELSHDMIAQDGSITLGDLVARPGEVIGKLPALGEWMSTQFEIDGRKVVLTFECLLAKTA